MSTDEVQGLSTKTSMLLGSMALRDLRLEASLESSCVALSDSKLDQLGVDHWVEASTVRTIIQSITTDTFLTNWNCFCLFVETLILRK